MVHPFFFTLATSDLSGVSPEIEQLRNNCTTADTVRNHVILELNAGGDKFY